MTSSSSHKIGPWLEINLDPRGLAYVKTTKPSDLAWEGIGGTIHIVGKWNPEAKSSSYAPKGDVLIVKHAVVSAVLDELVAAALKISRRKSGSVSIAVHGTPLELTFNADRDAVEVRILEYVDYSDQARTLGTLILSRNELLLTVAGVVEKFANRLVSENPSLATNSGLLSFKKQGERLRQLAR